MPYAVTFNLAMTFCSLLLEPETSKVTVPAALLYSISTLLTWIAESVWQLVKPEVLSTSTANAPLVNAMAANAAPHMSDLAISDNYVGCPFESGVRVGVPFFKLKDSFLIFASCVLH